LSIGEKFIQYGVLKREVETSRQLFDAIITRIKEQGVTQDIQTINAWVIEKAEIPKSPTKPDTRKNILFGLLAGLLGGVGFAFFIDYLDNTIKSPEEIEARFSVPVLGMIELLKPGNGVIEEIVLKEPKVPSRRELPGRKDEHTTIFGRQASENIVITSTSPRMVKQSQP